MYTLCPGHLQDPTRFLLFFLRPSGELVILLVILLLFFGAKRIPEFQDLKIGEMHSDQKMVHSAQAATAFLH